MVGSSAALSPVSGAQQTLGKVSFLLILLPCPSFQAPLCPLITHEVNVISVMGIVAGWGNEEERLPFPENSLSVSHLIG